MSVHRFHWEFPFGKKGKCALLGLFLGTFFFGLLLMGAMPAAAGFPGSHVLPPKIPTHPSGKTLKKIPFADLAVQSIAWKPSGTNSPEGEIVAEVKNVGTAASKPATLTGVLTCQGKTLAKKGFKLKALKPGERTRIRWKIHGGAGKNAVVLTVQDPINRKNNRREITFVCLSRFPKTVVKPLPLGKLRPDLAVTKITFDDLRLRETGTCQVRIEVKNVGTAPARASSVLVTFRGESGAAMRMTRKVKALKPGEVVTLRGAFRPRGKTLIVATVKDPVNKKNNTMKKTYLPGTGVLRILEKNLARKGDQARPGAASSTKGKGLEKIAEINQIQEGVKVPRASKTPANPRPTPRQGDLYTFIHPKANETVALGCPYSLQWVIPEQAPDTRLSLVLHAVDTPQSVPELTIARGLTPDIRLFTWKVDSTLPRGKYELSLVAERGGAVAALMSVSIRLGFPSLIINNKIVEPEHPRAGESVNIKALLSVAGADATRLFLNKITIEGPSFHAVKMVEMVDLDAQGGMRLLSTSFIPPLPGQYRVVFDLDVTHLYPHSTDLIREEDKTLEFQVNGTPDLLLYVNKVPDGALGEEKIFRIVVKNIGEGTSLGTTVLFQLTGSEDREISIPALDPGEESVHEVKGKWRQVTGKKIYHAIVDPANRISESDETNNEVWDTLHIYADRASIPPLKGHRKPRLVVERCYGLEGDIAADTRYPLRLRLKNVSPDRISLPKTWIGLSGPDTIQPKLIPLRRLYPGESIMVRLNARWKTPGTGQLVVKQLSRDGNRYRPVGTLFSKELTVEESPRAMHNVAEVVTQREPVRRLGGQGKHLTILRPNRDIFWVKKETVQIAWMGDVSPPYTVTLFPDGHPDQAVTIGENVTQNTLRYEVAKSLSTGPYRLRVHGADGGGMSHIFEIRGARAKPDLKVKMGTVNDMYSGIPSMPHFVCVKVIIENTGGKQRKAFGVRIRVDDTDDQPVVGPLLKQKTAMVEARFRVEERGPHRITIEIDPENEVDESDETNNTFTVKKYFCHGYPDLRLACRQRGNMLLFYVKNIGEAPSPRTQVVFYQLSNAFPMNVPEIRPGKVITIPKRLNWQVDQIGLPYSAKVNPAKTFRELRDDNNSCSGKIVQPYDTKTDETYYRYWRTWLKVEDKTPQTLPLELQVVGHEERPSVKLEFILSNLSSCCITPSLQAILKISQGGTQITRVFQVPELLPEDAHGNRDTYHILYRAPLSASDGRIYYRLTLKWGNEEMWGSQGVVEPPPLSVY